MRGFTWTFCRQLELGKRHELGICITVHVLAGRNLLQDCTLRARDCIRRHAIGSEACLSNLAVWSTHHSVSDPWAEPGDAPDAITHAVVRPLCRKSSAHMSEFEPSWSSTCVAWAF